MEDATPKPWWTSWTMIFNIVSFGLGLATVVMAYLVQSEVLVDYRDTLLAVQLFFNQLGNFLLRIRTVRPISLTDERPPPEFR